MSCPHFKTTGPSEHFALCQVTETHFKPSAEIQQYYCHSLQYGGCPVHSQFVDRERDPFLAMEIRKEIYRALG